VPYFHVVFTVPEAIAAVAFQNQTGGLRHLVPGSLGDTAHDRR
jgi:hypothetical protein